MTTIELAVQIYQHFRNWEDWTVANIAAKLDDYLPFQCKYQMGQVVTFNNQQMLIRNIMFSDTGTIKYALYDLDDPDRGFGLLVPESDLEKGSVEIHYAGLPISWAARKGS